MDETPEESRAVDTDTTVTVVTQWLTWITEMEMHQTLRQQLEHPNAQYHLHLEATYTAQLQQHHAEKVVPDGGRGPDNDMYLPAFSPNRMETITDIMERVVPTIADPPDQHAITTDEAVHQPQASSPQRPPRRLSARHTRNYCEEEVHQCPLRYEQPYGKREGVAISTSGLPGAGRGLFGIRPHKGNPLLFKQANEFVCVYATMQDVITVTEAQATDSAYVWTNSKNLHLDWDPAALYFDARGNHHYGQMVNDSWSDAGNNCTIKWNAKRRRVKELGAAYNDPYWYRPNNGIRTYEQAVQIRNYYNKTELPPYGEHVAEANTQVVLLH